MTETLHVFEMDDERTCYVAATREEAIELYRKDTGVGADELPDGYPLARPDDQPLSISDEDDGVTTMSYGEWAASQPKGLLCSDECP